jgi:ribonuclease BN (tRNA processing enzyme)
MTTLEGRNGVVDFDIWGTRGSRNLVPTRSRIGNNTSCYSLLQGEHLFVIDGGRGLAALGHAVRTVERFNRVKRITLFVGHAHMDHWEGLKDSDWFWNWPKQAELELEVYGPSQTLKSIRDGYAHPSFVPLEILAENNLADLRFRELGTDDHVQLRGWELRTYPLNHYSGAGDGKRYLDTLGLRVRPIGGQPVVCYLCDHEPTEATWAIEQEIVKGAHLALLDAHFPNIADHAFGHGSQEHASKLAKAFPDIVFLATHHGPSFSDQALLESFERHTGGIGNLRLAVEGTTLQWDVERALFDELQLDTSNGSSWTRARDAKANVVQREVGG